MPEHRGPVVPLEIPDAEGERQALPRSAPFAVGDTVESAIRHTGPVVNQLWLVCEGVYFKPEWEPPRGLVTGVSHVQQYGYDSFLLAVDVPGKTVVYGRNLIHAVDGKPRVWHAEWPSEYCYKIIESTEGNAQK